MLFPYQSVSVFRPSSPWCHQRFGLYFQAPQTCGIHFQVCHLMVAKLKKKGFSWRLSDKESVCQCRRCKRCRFNPWGRKIPWRRKWQPTAVFLSGASHGQRSLAGYNHPTFSIMLHSRQKKEKGTGKNVQTKCIFPLLGDFPKVTPNKFYLHLIGHKACHKP